MADMSNVRCLPKASGYLFSPPFVLALPLRQSLPLLLNLPPIAGRMETILVVAFGPLRLNDFCCLIYHKPFCGVHNTRCTWA